VLVIKEKELTGDFVKMAAAKENPVVWEIGVKRSIPERSTLHRDLVPHAKQFVGVDKSPGLDVDLVADVDRSDIDPSVVQALANKAVEFPDIVIAWSVFEHLERPWNAAEAIGRVLKKDGLVFVHTHQTYPLHAYPVDMWRFTIESLSLIFRDAGFEVEDCSYFHPCLIVSKHDPEGHLHPAFLTVAIIAKKP